VIHISRKLATVRTITDILPIPNADSIEVAVVDGWECVVRKSENYKKGDMVVYVEVDSIMPERPEYEFLRPRKFRVKTIKLRGQVSQGLVLPLSCLNGKAVDVGDDVTDILGVKKYDPQSEQEEKLFERKNKKWYMRYAVVRRILRSKNEKRPFPSWIKKTDEERIQNLPQLFNQNKNTWFIATEKIDGQSATYFLERRPLGLGYNFGVCSRNWQFPAADGSSYWVVAKEKRIRNVLVAMAKKMGYRRIVLQGEIIGPGIQGNKYGLKEYDFYAFNLILDGRKQSRLTMEARLDVISYFGLPCIKTVPVAKLNFALGNTIPETVELAKGKSQLADIEREGIVVRNHEKNISFKIINPDFLLKHEE